MIKDWINSKYLDSMEINKIRSKFMNNKPFHSIVLSDFLNLDKAKDVKNTLLEQEYYIEEHDLYKFMRTINFKDIKDKKIKDFTEFISSNEFISFMENLTGLKFVRDKFELHSLNFHNTHYLLCHDDQVQERSIAFIIYFCEDFNKDDGGELELFNSNSKGEPTTVVQSILPKFNQFTCFEVSTKSYHQVNEVLVDKDRLSIGGWFYK